MPLPLLISSKQPSAQEEWIRFWFQFQLALEIKTSASQMTEPQSYDQCMSTIPLLKSSSIYQKLKMNKSVTEQQQLLSSQVNYLDKEKNSFIKECIHKLSLLDGEWLEMLLKRNFIKLPEITLLILRCLKMILSILPKLHSAPNY